MSVNACTFDIDSFSSYFYFFYLNFGMFLKRPVE